MEVKVKEYSTHHLVKSEDLNHHGTLFAGRSAEWFVESGFVAASSIVQPNNIVCLKIHGMHFLAPAKPGQTICYASKIIATGKTSIIAHINVYRINEPETSLVNGFITFVHVTEHTTPCPHNIVIIAETEADKALQQQALALKK